MAKTKNRTGPAQKKETRGAVLDVVRELLAGGRGDEVLQVVAKLVARNAELETLLGKLRERNRREHISSDQLDLFLDQLLAAMGGELAEADAKLNETAEQNGGREDKQRTATTTQPERQPPVRRPPPPGLRRVANPISVPPDERACPVCRSERTCIGHDTTEVIELVPRARARSVGNRSTSRRSAYVLPRTLVDGEPCRLFDGHHRRCARTCTADDGILDNGWSEDVAFAFA